MRNDGVLGPSGITRINVNFMSFYSWIQIVVEQLVELKPFTNKLHVLITVVFMTLAQCSVMSL